MKATTNKNQTTEISWAVDTVKDEKAIPEFSYWRWTGQERRKFGLCFSLFDTNRSKTCTNNASSNISGASSLVTPKVRHGPCRFLFMSTVACLETQPDSKYLCRVFQPKKCYLALVLLAYIWWKSLGVLDWRASCLCPPCPRWRWGTAATKHSTETRKPKLASVLNAWSQISAMLAFHSKTVKSSGVGPKPKSKRAKTWT